MGFAVVAEEVRALAKRCADAARDTASLIEESIKNSGRGATTARNVAEIMHGITSKSAIVRSIADEVRVGSEEQTRGIQQVAQAMTRMEQVTQRTAGSAQESACAAVELATQSRALQSVVERVTDMVGSAR